MFSKIYWIFVSVIGITNTQANELLQTIVLPPELTTALDDFLNSKLEDLGFPEKTNCNHTCEDGLNIICYLKMHVESYQAMGAACGMCASGVQEDCQNLQCITADGIEKNVVSINRQIPGPLIQACQNDLIVVDVYNHMHSDSLSIHWHGMHQKHTQYMDGVPFITQCPIHPNNRFRYSFWAKESGTHFYHSHSGIQRYNGAFGGLIIRKPLSLEATSKHYDMDEHVIILTDWSHNAPELFHVGLPTRKPGPEAVLINGKGKFLDPATQTFSPTPYETFYVTRDLRYRFRIINAGSDGCPMEMQIQDHNMTVISVDGNDVEPVTVDTLMITTGERFDVVVKTDKNSGLYLILVKLVGTCRNQKIFQNAMLSYDKSSKSNLIFSSSERNYDGYPRGDTMNDIFVPCDPPENWCIKNLNSLETNFNWFKPIDKKLYLKFSMKALKYPGFFKNSYNTFYNPNRDRLILGTINGVSFHPPSYPLISQNGENDINKFCYDNTSLPKHCEDMQICTCTHIIDIPQHSFVELVLIDEEKDITLRAHPIHLHGYRFAVMTQGRILINESLTEEIVNREIQGLIKNDIDPPLKDNIAVPSHGYAVIRFLADNPGTWMLHCHVEYHMVFGMSVIVRVGGNVPPAPLNFPRCGNF